jgi:GNAT superfamily N-acetyltransferase
MRKCNLGPQSLAVRRKKMVAKDCMSMKRITAKISIRNARVEDASAFVHLHYQAVHAMAADSYEKSILDSWSSSKFEERIAAVERSIKENPDNAFKLMAEVDGVIVGLGEVVPGANELRAVYVAPQAARLGIGSAILDKLEDIAREKGSKELWLDASLNAESFYVARGYKSEERGVHELRSGEKMDCIKMRKTLVRK